MRKLILPLVFLSIFLLLPFFVPSKIQAVWTKSNSNPVITNSPSGWDSAHAADPVVLKDGAVYKIWYTGVNGSNSYIGYAISSDGITWTKDLNNPLSSFGNNAEHPFVLKDGSIYKMWYNVRINGGSSFEIKYATSADGIIWDVYPQSVIVPESGWSNWGVGTPTVIKRDAIYNMWFVGGQIGGTWQTGYATSTDGVTWNRHPDPVVTPGPGEGGVTSPSVLDDNNVLEMWYTADNGIGHAWSIDGINWIKDPSNPVLTIGSGQNFDNYKIGGNTIVRENGIDTTWYTGIQNNIGGKWQIGYASQPTELPPITPPPSPTPTLTPTLTPTPTPVHSGPNPVVLIPGLGASWNQSDLFSCNVSQSGTWTPAPYTDVYDRVIRTFTQNAGLQLNQNFYLYSYDWRQPMDTAGQKLSEYIETLNLPDGKVDIVAHSLGGLVARSYIILYPSTHKVGKLVTLGTPHNGTPLAYPIWENGEIWTDNFVDRIGIHTLINFCRTKVGNPVGTKRQAVQAVSPSIRDILPTYDFIKKNGQIVTNDLVEGENPWLLNYPFSSPFFGATLLTVSGIQKDTLEFLEVKNPSSIDVFLGNWKDGEPKKKISTKLGDGTVLTASSLLDGADSTTFNLSHIGLIQNTQSIKRVLEFLGYPTIGAAGETRLAELVVESSFSITLDKPGTLTLKTIKGETLQTESEGILTYYSDSSSKYMLTVNPSEDGTYIIGYEQVSKKDSDYWKEIKITMKANKPKSFIINYNPKKASSAPIVGI